MLTQADAATYDPIWLLDFELEGRSYRYNSGPDPITATRADGLSYIYRPGMSDVRLSAGESSASVEVVDGTDWAALAAGGANMEGGRAVLRRWWPSLKLDEAAAFASGLVRAFEFGEASEPVVFTIEARANDTGYLLPLNAKATSSMQGGVYEVYEQTQGQPFPIVIGYPGEKQDAAGTTYPIVPCVMTDYHFDTSALDLSRAVMSVGRLAASGVDIRFEGDVQSFAVGRTIPARVPAFAQIPTHDGVTPIDMTVSYFDFTGNMVGTPATTVSQALPSFQDRKVEYYAGFKVSTGGGIQNPYASGTLAEAGDVIPWALRTAGGDLAVDYDALETIRGRLTGYRIDTYVNDPEIRGLDWLRRAVLPLLPVVETSTVNGWALAYFDYCANETDAIGELVAGLNVERSTPAAVINADQIVNHVTVQYRPTGTGRGYFSQITVTGDLYYPGDVSASGEIDNPTYPHKIAQISQARHGVRTAEISVAETWDDSTALRIAQDVLKARGLALLGVTYDGLTDALERAKTGDVYLLTDPAMGWDKRIAIVYDVEVGGNASPSLTLALPDPLLKRPTNA